MKKILSVMMLFILLLTSCADKGVYVAEVGGEKISADEVEFYLESVKSQMAGTELSTDEDWQTKEIEGKKAIEIAKERALDTAITNLMYIEVAKELGIKLTQDEKSKISQNKEQFVNQFSSKKEYKEYLKENKITDGFIDMLCESMMYSQKLLQKAYEESPLSMEDVNQYFEENKEEFENIYRKAKHILFLTKDMQTNQPLSDEEIANKEAMAQDTLKRINQGEDFDTLMNEFSEDTGLKTNPDGYVFTDGEMVKEFQDGVDALSVGGIGFVESTFGYHILLRLPLTSEDVSTQIQNILLESLLLEKMDKWEEELQIKTEIYNEAMEMIG